MHSLIKHNSIEGFSRDIDVKSYGRTSDVLQLALPHLGGNKKGYFAPKKQLSKVGERVEADYFFS